MGEERRILVIENVSLIHVQEEEEGDKDSRFRSMFPGVGYGFVVHDVLKEWKWWSVQRVNLNFLSLLFNIWWETIKSDTKWRCDLKCDVKMSVCQGNYDTHHNITLFLSHFCRCSSHKFRRRHEQEIGFNDDHAKQWVLLVSSSKCSLSL